MMTLGRAIELLDIEKKCVTRASCNECNRNCEKCDLVQDDKELIEMYDFASSTLNRVLDGMKKIIERRNRNG